MIPGTGLQALSSFPPAMGFASGLSGSILSHPWAILLILLGLLGLALGVTGIIQTRAWPKGTTEPAPRNEPENEPGPEPDPTPAPVAPVAPIPSPAADEPKKGLTTIGLPEIEARHPDVWDPTTPLQVTVHTRVRPDPDTDAQTEASLHLQQQGNETLVARLGLDAQGQARTQVQPQGKGESILIVRIQQGDKTQDSTTRTVRFVDYRNEIVETFEDFEKWATSHYPPLARRLTAREFVDRYADLVPGTPIEPLDRIVDIYELANYSDHEVDRALYLELVDAFLQLEDAGSLDGPKTEAV